MVEHTPLLNLAMDLGSEILECSSEESAMGEDWSMDLLVTRTNDDRPSQFLVPYAWLLPSAMRLSQGLTGDDDLDGSNQPMAGADGDEEPSQTNDLSTPTQGTFMDIPTQDVTLRIARLSIIEHAPAVVLSEMLVPTSTFHSAHHSVNAQADLDTVPFENFNPTDDTDAGSPEESISSVGSPITGPDVMPLTTWVEEVLERLETRSGVASNDGQQHIPAVSIWSRRQPYLIQGDIPEVLYELYGEGVIVQARRTRGFPHPYRSDGRIHKSFIERRRRIAAFDVCQAARTSGRPDIDSDEKTLKYNRKPSENDSNNFGVSDGDVGNMTADVRLGEAFEPSHAVDDVANFEADVVVDEKGSKNLKRANVNAKSHPRAENQAEHSPKSRGEDSSIATSYGVPAPAPASPVAIPHCRVSSATAPVVLLDIAPVPVPVPLLVAPVIDPPVEIPLEEPLSMPGAWLDPVPMYRPPGQRPLWDVFADWFDDSWEALFGVVIEQN